ncbi:MAG: tyrosine-protein phosphatase [Spongiibacteraceae bacterium]|nr:tyrosine-protein phosphatase [Spongiibacteraceae bacterium]
MATSLLRKDGRLELRIAEPLTPPFKARLGRRPEPALDDQLCHFEHFQYALQTEASADRLYVHLEDGRGRQLTLAERCLPFRGTPNFRDLGGYPGAAGAVVRWGMLYRSGQLATLTDDDLGLMSSLALATICDFRREEEQRREPTRLPPESDIALVALPIDPGSMARLFEDAAGEGMGAQDMVSFMEAINREFVIQHREVYRRFFDAVLASPGPLLFHCAAGKDRTGFAAALLLSALGVEWDVVLEDYMLTRDYLLVQAELSRLADKYGAASNPALLTPVLEARASYLQSGREVMDQEFGGVTGYLRDGLGLEQAEISELRGRYLSRS